MMDVVDTNRLKFSTDVINETSAKIRSFLYELAEGTSNYRSLHNLTEQVEHQYHGRFLIELLQNAHDALNEKPAPDETSRIEIALIPEEGLYGTLYVANDGRPFSESNFKSLSQLGQSDKDPQASIGNKGIGFRSVLEITSSPEVYSRCSAGSPVFDGYCFGFNPSVIDKFRDVTVRLVNEEDKVKSPLDASTPLVGEWGAELLQRFRSRLKPKGDAWLGNELSCLSPYLLPFPIEANSKDRVLREYEQRGFATVIRFPLKSNAARDMTRAKIEELEAKSIVFLERVTSLVLDSGAIRRDLKRKLSCMLPGCHNGHEITIRESLQETPSKYWVWSESITIARASEELQQAVRDLPGKWPELKEAVVMVAVGVTETPESGVFSIFLPTEMATGSGAYVNASFYGDMSRTTINLNNPYNRLLLSSALEIALDVVLSDLVGRGAEEARAIVDILAPWPGKESTGSRWFGLIREALAARQLELPNARIFLSDIGWLALEDISFIPAVDNPSIMNEQLLRKHAQFPTFVSEMSSRKALLESLFEANGIGENPSVDDLACTVESLAAELHQNGGKTDWNGFWTDAIELFHADSTPLKGKQVLLGTDGDLHASGEECSVFFIPRRGISDDEEMLNEGAVHEIPAGLKKYVAFLHEDIRVYDEKDTRTRTDVHKFLDTKLVQTFRVEDILTSVLIRRTPKLPSSFRSPEEPLCADIMLWGLRLVFGLVERGTGGKPIRLLQSLPVPCEGGWYALREATFGPGWPNTSGDHTRDYLTGAGTVACVETVNRLLLPPSDGLWSGNGNAYQALLTRAGVFDGLRLISVEPTDWQARFLAARGSFQLPEAPPPGISQSVWHTYRSYVKENVKLAYRSYFHYEIQSLSTVPGIDRYANLSEPTRHSFMNVILKSITNWKESWSDISIKKVDGNPDRTTLVSPLAYMLRELAWLGIERDEKVEWSRPSERWYVTAGQLSGRPRQFAHLKPLSGRMAQLLDGNPMLADALLKLGMPKFDIETLSESTRLLDDLAGSLYSDISESSVFLGQVRDAWRAFDPKEDGKFPQTIVVRRGNAPLFARAPSEDEPVYLPDSSASFMAALEQFSLPVVAIDTSDAKRLAKGFKRSYRDGVQLASEIEMIPLVNGERWQGTPGTRLSESELEWIVAMVLTLVAFSGMQAKGTNAKPFRERVQMFREATICWVPSLEAGLFKGKQRIASPAVPAIWVDKSKVLVANETCKETPSQLSEAISQLVSRDDLELPIRLVLKEIQNCEPEQQDVLKALEQLKIKENDFKEVLEQWRGDLGQIIRMIRPVVLILDPGVDVGKLLELQTEDAVVSFLNHQGFLAFDGKGLLVKARQARDRYEFGVSCFNLYGEGAQLAKWNSVLVQLGETPLINECAQSEFRDNLETVLLPLNSLLASILQRNPTLGFFKHLSGKLNSLQCPQDYAQELWEVGFHDTMRRVVSLFEQWQASPGEIAALERSNTEAELVENLKTAGVDTGFDPLATFSQNLESVKTNLQCLQRAGVCWCLRQKGTDPSLWEKSSDQLLEAIAGHLEEVGFTAKLTECDVFDLLKTLPRDGSHHAFWGCIDASTSIGEVLTTLAITDDDLANAQAKLDEYKEQLRRQKRLVRVCGKEFDNSEENLSGLWSHIRNQIADERLDLLASVDLGKHANIEGMGTRKKKKEDKWKRNPGKKPNPRLTKSMEDLIGLAGEIHVFRMLQKKYGTPVVHQATWVSRNSNYVFPGNETDDGRGCDFVVRLKKTIYCVEVKASKEDEDAFKFGSSEINLAKTLVNNRRRRKETFVVIHVINALSEEPIFRMLPNPYDARYQSLFAIEDADTRVRYRPNKNP